MTRKDKMNLLSRVLNGDKQALKQLRTRQVDYTKFTDDELEFIITTGKLPARVTYMPIGTPPPKPDTFSRMSDEELDEYLAKHTN